MTSFGHCLSPPSRPHPPLEDWIGSCQENLLSLNNGIIITKAELSVWGLSSISSVSSSATGFLILFLWTYPRVLFTCQREPSDGFGSELNIYHWFFYRKLHVIYLPVRRHCALKNAGSANVWFKGKCFLPKDVLNIFLKVLGYTDSSETKTQLKVVRHKLWLQIKCVFHLILITP